MRVSSLVQPADVLLVRLLPDGGDRHRIVLYSNQAAGRLSEISVKAVQDALAKRISGLEPGSIQALMSRRGKYWVHLVLSLPAGISERKAAWYRFEVQRVLNDQPRLVVAKNSPSHRGKTRYRNSRVAIASASAA